jgi:hypothetical protein
VIIGAEGTIEYWSGSHAAEGRGAACGTRDARRGALDFRQRFTGTFGADGNTIDGAWESGRDGGGWEHDFALTYRRAN